MFNDTSPRAIALTLIETEIILIHQCKYSKYFLTLKEVIIKLRPVLSISATPFPFHADSDKGRSNTGRKSCQELIRYHVSA